MEQETKDVLGQFAQRLIDMLEKGIDVAGQEIPILLNEVLVWGFFADFLPFILFLVVCIASLVLIVKNSDMKAGFKQAREEMAERLGGLTEHQHCSRHRNGHTTQLDCGWFTEVDCQVLNYYKFGTFGLPCLVNLVIGGFSLVLFTCLLFAQLDWVKVLLAPRLYLLEYASKLL